MANPNKPKPISDILIRNRDKLVEFLSQFHTDRTEDEQFNDEKAYLIKQACLLAAERVRFGAARSTTLLPPYAFNAPVDLAAHQTLRESYETRLRGSGPFRC